MLLTVDKCIILEHIAADPFITDVCDATLGISFFDPETLLSNSRGHLVHGTIFWPSGILTRRSGILTLSSSIIVQNYM